VSLLDIADLAVAVPGGRAVDGASFALEPGEVLGLMGESGAGKSLTGAAVIGLLPPPTRLAGGSIRFAGTPIEALPEAGWRRLRGRRISAVFQDPLTALDPMRRIGTQLAETLRVHAAPGTVTGWLEAVGLPPERARSWPHQLSGGMRQRVAVALALAPRPALLIADEPTTALDQPLRAQMARLLRGLATGQGSAVLLISHDLGTIAAAADRVAVMYAGRVVEQGPAAAVLHRPAHPYTAALLAARPGTAARPARLAAIEGAMPPPGAVPEGCAFHPRCPRATSRCVHERPSTPRLGAACWHPLREAADG
jgi:peptide/nickel transport system ATP-binding protein